MRLPSGHEGVAGLGGAALLGGSFCPGIPAQRKRTFETLRSQSSRPSSKKGTPTSTANAAWASTVTHGNKQRDGTSFRKLWMYIVKGSEDTCHWARHAMHAMRCCAKIWLWGGCGGVYTGDRGLHVLMKKRGLQ